MMIANVEQAREFIAAWAGESVERQIRMMAIAIEGFQMNSAMGDTSACAIIEVLDARRFALVHEGGILGR